MAQSFLSVPIISFVTFLTDALKDVSCDFEQAFSCGYTFGQSDTSATPYAWHRWKGKTPNSNTGPDSDHTKGDASGSIEALLGSTCSLITLK